MDKRKIEENFFKILMIFSTLAVGGSVVLIIATILFKGLPALTFDMLVKTPKGGYYLGKEGGILNAILGSIVLGIGATILALLVALPIVFYLNLYLRKNSKLALAVRFFLDVLWGGLRTGLGGLALGGDVLRSPRWRRYDSVYRVNGCSLPWIRKWSSLRV